LSRLSRPLGERRVGGFPPRLVNHHPGDRSIAGYVMRHASPGGPPNDSAELGLLRRSGCRRAFTVFHETPPDFTIPRGFTQRIPLHARRSMWYDPLRNTAVRSVSRGTEVGIHTDEVTGSNPVPPTLLNPQPLSPKQFCLHRAVPGVAGNPVCGVIVRRNPGNPRPRRPNSIPSYLHGFAFTAGGARLVPASGDDTLRVWVGSPRAGQQ
jgi:hypothetical protein